MAWQQVLIGAIVGQVAEWVREHRQRPRQSPKGPPMADPDDNPIPEVIDTPPETERAPGGRLNPLNATEDMLRRAIDYAQFRTDQSVRRAVAEFRSAVEQQWPLASEKIKVAADRAVEQATERLEGMSKRLAEDVAARTSIVVDEKLAAADRMLRAHREEMSRQLLRLLIASGIVLLVVGVALILLAAYLFRG